MSNPRPDCRMRLGVPCGDGAMSRRASGGRLACTSRLVAVEIHRQVIKLFLQKIDGGTRAVCEHIYQPWAQGNVQKNSRRVVTVSLIKSMNRRWGRLGVVNPRFRADWPFDLQHLALLVNYPCFFLVFARFCWKFPGDPTRNPGKSQSLLELVIQRCVSS